MSNNPFDRNKTKEAKLGQLITEPGEQNQRDAVHIAVVPIIASTGLTPGQRIAVNKEGTHSVTGNGLPIGIVDPFLATGPKTGETFWLFLFQGSVNTLRHEWTHDAFPAVNAALVPASDKAASESWLRLFAKGMKPYDDAETAYRNLLEELANDEVYFHGTDSDYDIKDNHEFWRHVSIVMGKIPDLDNLSIRCSC